MTKPDVFCCCASGWICESHPAEPMGHDGCIGVGRQCENPLCLFWLGAVPTAHEVSEWTDVVSTRERPRRDH